MARIAGVDIPDQKRIEAALPYIFGVGPSLARKILLKTGVDPNKRTKSLEEDEIAKIQKEVESFKIEGDLRREVVQNIQRLKEIGAYKGTRHARSLPVHGQRTRTNARTKRGRRVTIGTIRKGVVKRMGVRVQPGQAARVTT